MVCLPNATKDECAEHKSDLFFIILAFYALCFVCRGFFPFFLGCAFSYLLPPPKKKVATGGAKKSPLHKFLSLLLSIFLSLREIHGERRTCRSVRSKRLLRPANCESFSPPQRFRDQSCKAQALWSKLLLVHAFVSPHDPHKIRLVDSFILLFSLSPHPSPFYAFAFVYAAFMGSKIVSAN